MTVFAIGDVQGCFDQLQRLLDRLRFKPDRDRLWFCGDLVNRGPRSLEVLRFVRSLGDGAVTVLGNHDLYLISSAREPGMIKGRNDTLAPVLQARDSDKLLNWLAKRPFFHYDEKHAAALVHAGIPPGWSRRQTKKRAARLHKRWRKSILDSLREPPPRRWHPRLSAIDKDRFTCAALTRMRFVDKNGLPEYSAKGHPDNYAGVLRPWFDYLDEDWDGTLLFFGHWSTLDETGLDEVIALDSGCVWGRRLSAVRVSGNRQAGKRFSVNCKELAGPS